MAIIGYVPPIKYIRDNRSTEGNYFIAKCDICDTQFYPSRSSAKYCTPNCGLIAHRQAVANGTATKREYKFGGSVKKENIKPTEVKVPRERMQERIESYKSSPAFAKTKELIAKAKERNERKLLSEVWTYLKTKYDTHGHKDEILSALRNMKIGDSQFFFDSEVYRFSTQKFRIT
jgi:hypothetical protein